MSGKVLCSSDSNWNGAVLEHYNHHHGLDLVTIESIIQSADGYLWLLGDMGELLRYNGARFNPVDLFPGIQTRIYRMWQSGAGSAQTIWLCTNRGLFGLRQGQLFHHIPQERLPKGHYFTIVYQRRNGSMLLGTNKGAGYIYSEGDLRQVFVLNRILSIVEDHHNKVWIAGGISGLHIFDKTLQKIVLDQEDLSVFAVHRAKNNHIWVGSNRGLFQIRGFNTQGQVIRRIGKRNGLPSDSIFKIREDRMGNLIVGGGNGASRVGVQRHSVQIDTLLKRKPVKDILIDRDGSLWFGTYNDALFRYRRSRFKTVANGVLEPCLYLDRQDTVLIGTAAGTLLQLNKEKIAPSLKFFRGSGFGITAICRDHRGDLWLGTLQRGFYRFNRGQWQRQQVKATDFEDGTRNIYRDSKNRIWIGTIHGLYCYEDNEYRYYSKKNGLADNNIHQVYEDNSGDMWFCTPYGLTVARHGRFEPGHILNYMQDVNVVDILQDAKRPDIFWIGTQGRGLCQKRQDRFSYAGRAAGLNSDSILKMVDDETGHYWFSTYSAIGRVRRVELMGFFSGQRKHIPVRYFGREDGIRHPEGCYRSDNTVVKMENGILLFSMKQGIAITDPRKPEIIASAPSFNILNIIVDGKRQQSGQNNFIGMRHLRIEFDVIAFIGRRRMKIQYKLAGVDRDWRTIAPESGYAVEYDDLPAGQFSFRLKGSNSQDIWNLNRSQFDFSHSIYFYQTELFKISVILAGGLLIILVFIWGRRYRQLKKLEKRYRGSRLAKAESIRQAASLKLLMEKDRIFLDASLSLKQLAARLDIPPRDLSRIINENFSRNFNDFVNYYRIEEAKRILMRFNKETDAIVDICYDVGFNSKTPFYDAFKKFTGQSPLQYFKDQFS